MIWTCDSSGSFKGSVVIENGKIKAIGKNITNLEGYEKIDGTNLHLTPGIIDEHSHIALKNGLHCQTLDKQSNKKTAYPDSLPWMGLSRHEMDIDTRNLILFY